MPSHIGLPVRQKCVFLQAKFYMLFIRIRFHSSHMKEDQGQGVITVKNFSVS